MGGSGGGTSGRSVSSAPAPCTELASAAAMRWLQKTVTRNCRVRPVKEHCARLLRSPSGASSCDSPDCGSHSPLSRFPLGPRVVPLGPRVVPLGPSDGPTGTASGPSGTAGCPSGTKERGRLGTRLGRLGPFLKATGLYTRATRTTGGDSRNRLGARGGKSRGRVRPRGGDSRGGGRRLGAARRPARTFTQG